MLKDLAELLEIESVLGDSEKNAPFGKNIRLTLDWFLNRAKDYSLDVKDLDGYCGFAEVGNSNKCIGILAHLDVVPAGEGWSVPPYKLTEKDGYLYGRGVVDNKGCAIIALHVLKTLKEKNIKLNNRIRLIVGCNEENGSSCLKHYKSSNEEIPVMSIVPDSDFPIINSEKGIMHLVIKVPADEKFKQSIVKIEAGTRPNIVPDRALAELKINQISKENIELLNKESIEDLRKNKDYFIEYQDDKICIKTHGIAGHAMSPDKADNAIFKLFTILSRLLLPKSDETLSLIQSLFCKSCATKTLDIDISDKKSGCLTMNLGIINYEQNHIELTLDFRLPITANKDEIIEKIKAQIPSNSKIEVRHYSPNLYIDEDNKYVKTLLKVYKDITKNLAYTVQTGGGTYARELPNSLAFGPTFPGTITNIHNIDERISVEQFNQLFDIYYNSIIELDKMI